MEDIVTAKAISQDEIDELFEIIDDCLDVQQHMSHDDFVYKDLHIAIKKLPIDTRLTPFHIETIQYWLTEHKDSLQQWPGSVLTKALSKVCDLTILSAEDKRHLIDLVTCIGSIYPYHGDFHPSQAYTQGVIIKHTGQSFCFAGRFEAGERQQFEEKVKQLGGTVHKHLSIDTQYLVIGEHSDLTQPYSNPSRKLAKAKSMQDDQMPISIVSEKQWLNSVKQTYVNYGT